MFTWDALKRDLHEGWPRQGIWGLITSKSAKYALQLPGDWYRLIPLGLGSFASA